MNKSGERWLVHLPDVLLKDYRDVQDSLDSNAFPVRKGVAVAEFNWTEQAGLQGNSLPYSNSDDAHAIAFLPSRACEDLDGNGIQQLARQVFDNAVASIRESS